MSGFRNGLNTCIDYVLKCNCFRANEENETDVESWHSLPLVWANETHKTKAGAKKRPPVRRPKVVRPKRLRNPSEALQIQGPKIPKLENIRTQPEAYLHDPKMGQPLMKQTQVWLQPTTHYKTHPNTPFKVPSGVYTSTNPCFKCSAVTMEPMSYHKRSISQYHIPGRAPYGSAMETKSKNLVQKKETCDASTQTEEHRKKHHKRNCDGQNDERRKNRSQTKQVDNTKAYLDENQNTKQTVSSPKADVKLRDIGINIHKYLINSTKKDHDIVRAGGKVVKQQYNGTRDTQTPGLDIGKKSVSPDKCSKNKQDINTEKQNDRTSGISKIKFTAQNTNNSTIQNASDSATQNATCSANQNAIYSAPQNAIECVIQNETDSAHKKITDIVTQNITENDTSIDRDSASESTTDSATQIERANATFVTAQKPNSSNYVVYFTMDM